MLGVRLEFQRRMYGLWLAGNVSLIRAQGMGPRGVWLPGEGPERKEPLRSGGVTILLTF